MDKHGKDYLLRRGGDIMSYTLEQAINQFIKLSNDIMFKNVVFRNIHILEWYLNRIMCEFDKDCNITFCPKCYFDSTDIPDVIED